MLMESTTGKKKSSGSSNLLAPGFRFHPTDEELVRYYLRRKICGKPLRFNAISEIDIYKAEPWDLPYMSKLKTRDLEWYFFSVLDKKYGNGSRTNRATEKGYWKTTGKDRAVHHKTQVVGMKKTLVYHSGRAPKGQRTNWVMHEYRLTDLELETAGISQDAFVLCRIFQKSGSGPKNGEQYGAPFVEEEWDNDELEMVLEDEATEEVDFGCDAFLDGLDLQQILGSDDPSTTAPLPVNIKSSDSGDELICSLPASCDNEPVKQECTGESSKSGNFEDFDFLLDEPFLEVPDSLQLGGEGFIEANDFSNPGGNDTTAIDMLEEYLTFVDANDDSSLYFANNPDFMLGSKDLVSDQALLPYKVAEGNEQAILPTEQITQNSNKDEALLSDEQELVKYDSGYRYPIIKKASRMLGNIQAPPAFAAEFPPKDAVLRLNQSSSPVHVGMIQLRKSNMGVSKNDKFNLVLSFGYSQGDDGSSTLESSVRMLIPEKTVSSISRGLLYFIFFWVLILSMSFKLGTLICAN